MTRQKFIDKVIVDRNKWRDTANTLAKDSGSMVDIVEAHKRAFHTIERENVALREHTKHITELANALIAECNSALVVAETDRPTPIPRGLHDAISVSLEPVKRSVAEFAEHISEHTGQSVYEALETMDRADYNRFETLDGQKGEHVGEPDKSHVEVTWPIEGATIEDECAETRELESPPDEIMVAAFDAYNDLAPSFRHPSDLDR
jgi:hypothetical protein